MLNRMSEDIRPLNDGQIITFIKHLRRGKFLTGFVINDPDDGAIVHRRIHDTWAGARQAEAELQADLFDELF
jgi:hypothetical protein